jgi:hemoglobin
MMTASSNNGSAPRLRTTAAAIGLDAVRGVVDDFYNRVQRHPALAVPFSIVDDWDEHKAHLTHFWWVALGGAPYRTKPYNVAVKHMEAGFTPELLIDWLALFRQVLSEHLAPEPAAQWFERAQNIGRSLNMMHRHFLSGERRIA